MKVKPHFYAMALASSLLLGLGSLGCGGEPPSEETLTLQNAVRGKAAQNPATKPTTDDDATTTDDDATTTDDDATTTDDDATTTDDDATTTDDDAVVVAVACALEIGLECPAGQMDGCIGGLTKVHKCVPIPKNSCMLEYVLSCPKGQQDGCLTGDTTVHKCVPIVDICPPNGTAPCPGAAAGGAGGDPGPAAGGAGAEG